MKTSRDYGIIYLSREVAFLTVIEFFDETSIDNIESTLLHKPEKVVFIGNSPRKMKRSIVHYKRVTDARGISVEFDCVPVALGNLYDIVEKLAEIVETNPDCYFDICGGNELYLVALGVLEERYKEKVHLRTFRLAGENGVETACDAGGCVRSEKKLELSVEENVAVYGGRVIYTEEKGEGTVRRDYSDPQLRKDIADTWGVCRFLGERWNSIINCLDRVNKHCCDGNKVSVERRKHIKGVEDKEIRLIFESDFLDILRNRGIIRRLERSQDEVSFEYRNRNVKSMLTKAGLVLELAVALTAYELRGDDGKKVYNDVVSGVYIDWDGELNPRGEADVANEIDVMLMKNTVPVFISCKNGSVDVNELYKLSQVAERFGGRYAKKVLVASNLEKTGMAAEYIRVRAKDMNIRIVEDFDTADKKEIERVFKTFHKN